MSIQEIERELRNATPDEVRHLQGIIQERLAEIERNLARGKARAGGDGAPADEWKRELRELASKIDWQGGDGLEYQMRIRAEWDDRPGWDR